MRVGFGHHRIGNGVFGNDFVIGFTEIPYDSIVFLDSSIHLCRDRYRCGVHHISHADADMATNESCLGRAQYRVVDLSDRAGYRA